MFSIIFLVSMGGTGLAMVIAGWIWLAKARKSGVIPVEGEVTGYTELAHRGEPVFFAQYAVVLPDGSTITRPAVARGLPTRSPPIGTRAKLLYNPKTPDRPLARGGASAIMTPLIFFAVGGFMMVVGVTVSVAAWPRSSGSGGAPEHTHESRRR